MPVLVPSSSSISDDICSLDIYVGALPSQAWPSGYMDLGMIGARFSIYQLPPWKIHIEVSPVGSSFSARSTILAEK